MESKPQAPQASVDNTVGDAAVNGKLEVFMEKLDATLSAKPEKLEFKAKDLPVMYDLELPIKVMLPGSTIKYTFTTLESDIAFGVVTRPLSKKRNNGDQGGEDMGEGEERELIPIDRVGSHLSPITGTIRCPSSPCMVTLCFDNHYSWFSSKVLSYTVTLLPPSPLVSLRSHAKKLEAYATNASIDVKEAEGRIDKVKGIVDGLGKEIIAMERELEKKKNALLKAQTESTYLVNRVSFRKQQRSGVLQRLARVKNDLVAMEKEEKEEEEARRAAETTTNLTSEQTPGRGNKAAKVGTQEVKRGEI